jgi:hypothetical protein
MNRSVASTLLAAFALAGCAQTSSLTPAAPPTLAAASQFTAQGRSHLPGSIDEMTFMQYATSESSSETNAQLHYWTWYQKGRFLGPFTAYELSYVTVNVTTKGKASDRKLDSIQVKRRDVRNDETHESTTMLLENGAPKPVTNAFAALTKAELETISDRLRRNVLYFQSSPSKAVKKDIEEVSKRLAEAIVIKS